MHIHTYAGNKRFNDGTFKSHNGIVNCLVHNALTAKVPKTWTPPCGGTVAVVLIPCDKHGKTHTQSMLTQVPVKCKCK